MNEITVGLLEDEAPQADLLLKWLDDAGYATFHCDNGTAFLAEVESQKPQALILDWQLPDCEGIDVLAQVRSDLGFAGPVIFATAKDSEEDIVRGLSSGADDYLIKPLRQAELLARLQAVWRRAGVVADDSVTLGPIRLDLPERRAWHGDEEITLTPTEFKLATCVLTNPGRLLSRSFLLKEVWGVDAELDTRTVDMHMSRVRRSLKIGPEIGYCIKTVYRHGYRLEALQ